MDEKSFGEWLARRLGREEVPPSAWDILESKGLIADALISEDDREEVADIAKSLLPYADLMDGPAPTSGKPKQPLPEKATESVEYERLRAQAVGEHLAYVATSHPLVQRFREEVLGGKLLDSDAAWSFANSDALRLFPHSWFKEQSVPLVGHYADVRYGWPEYDSDEDFLNDSNYWLYDKVFVDPPGQEFDASMRIDGYRAEDLDNFEYLEPWPWGGPRERRFLNYVFAGSVLDELRKISLELAGETWHPWRVGQAAYFVLTGNAPSPRVLFGEVDIHFDGPVAHGTIILEVEPWVRPKVVAEAYGRLQGLALDQSKPVTPSLRNFRVFRFVQERLRRSLTDYLMAQERREEVPTKPPWRDMMKEWNEANPQDTYNDVRNFSRDYRRAYAFVVQPFGYYLPLGGFKESIP
jgi:hypothetical protein